MQYFFVNKNKRNLDKKRCSFYFSNYFDFFVIKNILKIENFNYNIESLLLFLIFKENYNVLKNKHNYKTCHKDISFLSGRTKFIFTKYGLARTDLKKLVSLNRIPNLKKSSW